VKLKAAIHMIASNKIELNFFIIVIIKG